MARSIIEIQNSMIAAMRSERSDLSTSKVAEWRLWTYVVAVAIHSFEVILDLFRSEFDTLTRKITPGTVRWYAEMCQRFQNGHELLFDHITARLYYAQEIPSAQIIKVAAIVENRNTILIKVATQDKEGKIVPLSPQEQRNFTGYIEAIKFAGLQTDIISHLPDMIRYDIEVFHEPSTPSNVIRENIQKALLDFKTSLNFDARFYPQRFIDTVMHTDKVVTVKLKYIERKGVTDESYQAVDIITELEAGYFEFDDDSTLTITPITEIS